MTIPVVQFCFAVAAGDKRLARDLLPQISETEWFAEDPILGSPALFCLWASKQSAETIKRRVDELNLSGLTNHPLQILSAEDVIDASKLALPTITKQVPALLKAMVSHMAPNTTGDDKKQFMFTTCVAALEFILKDSSIELPEGARTVAENMLTNFRRFDSNRQKETNARPAALDRLLEENKTYTPLRCGASRALEQRLDAFSETLRTKQRLLTMR